VIVDLDLAFWLRWSWMWGADEDADLSPGAIIGMVTAELTARRYAGVVRLEVSADMPESLQGWLATQFGADPAGVIATPGLLSLGDLTGLPVDGHARHRYPPHEPVSHPRLRILDRADPSAVFDEIRRGDILVHLPYHSFDTSILQFIQSAAADPAVLAIKLTIYRTGRRSPIIQALNEAARHGKQVAVLVEITARFDEAPNIGWARELQQAGAHVAYGVERVKTHVKLALGYVRSRTASAGTSTSARETTTRERPGCTRTSGCSARTPRSPLTRRRSSMS
jgi:polyphosphate kinase